MMSYFLYILKSNRNRHYIGFTTNLDRRIQKHNTIHNGFTGTTEKWELVIAAEFETKAEAIIKERYLKSLKNSQRAIKHLRRLI